MARRSLNGGRSSGLDIYTLRNAGGVDILIVNAFPPEVMSNVTVRSSAVIEVHILLPQIKSLSLTRPLPVSPTGPRTGHLQSPAS